MLKKNMLNLLKVAKRFAQKYPDAIFFDVGANIGLFTYYIVRINKKCHCFEPHPNYFNILKIRLVLLKIEKIFKNKIVLPTINQLGVSKEIGSLFLNFSSLPGSHSFIKEDTPSPTNQKCLSNITTLDNYFKMNQIPKKPIFIKIDIEGFEENAILGCMSVIKKYRPTFFIEVRKGKNKSKNTFDKVCKILMPHGYKIVNEQTEISKNKSEIIDILFCNKNFWDLNDICGDWEAINKKQKFFRIFKRLFRFELADLHHLAIRKPYKVDY